MMEPDTSGIEGRGFMRIIRRHAASKGLKVDELDLKNEIGLVAGDIYKAAQSRGECYLRDIRASLKTRGALFAAGLGWLLREEKIVLWVTKDGLKVRVK